MDFLKRAGEYFKNHLSVHTFHFTSDGMAFQGKSDAEAHARTLADSEVKTILRADVEVGDELVSKTESDPEADVNPGETTSENKDNNPEPEQLTGSTPTPEVDKPAKDSNKAKASKK